MPFSLAPLDRAIAAWLPLLGAWILLSALDDLVLLGAWLIARVRGQLPRLPNVTQLAATDHRRIAIFVPCWKESEVIAGMLRHNLAAIGYDRFAFFVGAYPNDLPTVTAIEQMAAADPRIHLALVPHDGPTSKADCLNWVYQRMLLAEEQSGERFDLVLMHDAEDLIHPEEMRFVNWFARDYGFIQTPVLPLATPPKMWVHGLYIDDFTECHTKDLPARWWLGGFIPSSGVGTAMRRDAIETLAASSSNHIFEPGSLTEDYELGCRMSRLGVRQLFVPVEPSVAPELPPLATREMFPTTFYTALRQRTRWVTGIALQGMERHGVGRTLAETWWFWRDRKGLLGNPLSLLANMMFLYGLATWAHASASHIPWGLGELIAASVPGWMVAATALAGLMQVGARSWLVSRVYGWRMAARTPLRSLAGNLLNGAATFCAVHRYLAARWSGRPLVWLKTSHDYPSIEALREHKRPLEEVLVGSRYLSEADLAAAKLALTPGTDLLPHLVQLGLITEGAALETLCLQHGVEAAVVPASAVRRELARALPRSLSARYRILPYAIVDGELQVASPHMPSEQWRNALRRHTTLNLRVVLVSESNYRRLCDEFL
ncbi:MAG: glycosyl transferase family protein [Bryobacterales bacterium]|nr:glycosyl transferase family protein [Bryobacterales bacterium]